MEVLDGMVKRGVEVRLIHADEPGPKWRDDFNRYPIVEQLDFVWRGYFCRENSPAHPALSRLRHSLRSGDMKASGCPTSVTRSLAKQGRKRPSGRRDFCGDPVV